MIRYLIPRASALVLLLGAAAPIVRGAAVEVGWDCHATLPSGEATQLSLENMHVVDSDVQYSTGVREYSRPKLVFQPQTLPNQIGDQVLAGVSNLTLRLSISANAKAVDWLPPRLSGGSNLGDSNATISNADGLFTLVVPGPILGTFTLPTLALTIQVTSPGQSSLLLAGVSATDPGLQFIVSVRTASGADQNIPVSCFAKPVAGSNSIPALATTIVNARDFSPLALGSAGNRTVAVTIANDVHYLTQWDLNGNTTGWNRIIRPISFGNSGPTSVALRSGGANVYIFSCWDGTTVDGQLTAMTGPLDQPSELGGFGRYGWRTFQFTHTTTAPAVGDIANHTMLLFTDVSGHVVCFSWRGGNEAGWNPQFVQMPGLRTTKGPAVAMVEVADGVRSFVLARDEDKGGEIMVNQGDPGAESWDGWKSMGIVSNVGPAASASGDRLIAAVVAVDGRVMYNWWDLGESSHGWKEIPGSLRTNVTVGVGFVGNGRCAFIVARDQNGDDWINQGDPTTGKWVGWLLFEDTVNQGWKPRMV